MIKDLGACELEEITDTNKYKGYIQTAIRKYGHCAEHNYYHYHHYEDDKEKNIFFKLEGSKGILSSYDKKNDLRYLFPSGILAPEEERFDILVKFLDYILKKKKGEKLFVEVNGEFRKEILRGLKDSRQYRACSSPFILYWPLYNMSKFDSKLKGKNWKKLRNIRNRFYKKNKVKVVDSKKVPKEQLTRILDAWLKRRNAHDRVEKHYFENLIENNLKGVEMARTLIVNGNPCSITAGWKIPNSKGYYSHVGIVDYSCEGLGEVANIEDLKLLKRKKYDYVDFGGSDKVLLYFKKKFKPEKIYKTYIFSIVKR
ncbi:DUF2156 domain-containing protein [Candidatus Woesearchaeota archaeon]|nr:DUF2156 domain-containing protein [Candidatus Woesearchaeota archaeon]